MTLQIASLNSGSNGNCYYIGNQQEAVLIDAGLSCRETEVRVARSGLNINKIKAVFITHEHSDHTRGVAVITRKYKIPLYISEKTREHSRLHLDQKYVRHIEPYAEVKIGNLSVNPFPKLHDASEPFSFTVTGTGITIGVMTDIGSVCDHVVHNFSKCHAVFLEANYDEDMLESGSYPVYLKTRIRSDHGHLSNHQALQLFANHKAEFMSHVLLSHLSQDNNDPRLVESLFKAHAGATHVAIASRHHESKVYTITGSFTENDRSTGEVSPAKFIQTSLF